MSFHNVPPNGFPDLPDMEEVEAVVKDVTNLKTSVSGLSEDVSDLNDNKANQITIAPFFNAETAYEVGDLVYYNGLSYRCTNAHEGEWDADDFAATTISNELASLMSGLTGLKGYVDARVSFYTTLADDVLDHAQDMGNNEVHFYLRSNKPTNRPTDCDWGSYLMFKTGGYATIMYLDHQHIATCYAVTIDTESLTWHIA